MTFSQLTRCRLCDSESLTLILNLGNQPLANALRTHSHLIGESRYPLKLFKCDICSLIQINVNIDPKLMFSDYNWVTGTSATSILHCENFVEMSTKQAGFVPDSLLEIGSNDGTLLSAYSKLGVRRLIGVDPASKLMDNYDSTILVENIFFDSLSARQIIEKYGKFDMVVARNVFSHIPNFIDVVTGVKSLLHSHSIFFMEFHWAYDFLVDLHYDSIYHEHTYYHSIASVKKALEKADLYIFDAFKSPISGGSVVIASSLTHRKPSSELKELVDIELTAKLEEKSTWIEFGKKSQENIELLKKFLDSHADKKICAFGASARSSTILNAIGSPANRILSIGENNPRKWGKFTPGFSIPIESVEEMLLKQPDTIIVFPFNFKSEILKQLAEMKWSGEVLLPIPHPPTLVRI